MYDLVVVLLYRISIALRAGDRARSGSDAGSATGISKIDSLYLAMYASKQPKDGQHRGSHATQAQALRFACSAWERYAL